jgi:DNA-binding GntR family transcriptional regulator
LAATIDAYAADEPAAISEAKSSFYDVLFRGAKSPTLGAMIDALSARVQRWRAVGLSHAKRSTERSQESVNDLSAIHAAIRAGDGELAERLARQEVMNAAAEIARLLEASGPAPPSPGPDSAGTAS